MKLSKKYYIEYLNEIGIPEDDKKSNGGRVSDNCNYGKWMQNNDPIGFECGYQEAELYERLSKF